ncbi:MAG: hypothetical protein HY716_02405 [Planctomycetes bacterium]|nr:hypothetical protein [Planctomycetota bacterium]
MRLVNKARLVGPRDLFDDPGFDRARDEADRIAEAKVQGADFDAVDDDGQRDDLLRPMNASFRKASLLTRTISLETCLQRKPFN